jgi:hypothetical protein
LMVPHELKAIITKRMLGLMSWYWWRRECVAMARWAERRDRSVWWVAMCEGAAASRVLMSMRT